jgi:Fe-S cluster biosynthesis and repair protein YggX
MSDVFCSLYHNTLPGLDQPPFPGELGCIIYKHVSKEAWQAWLAHQVKLINEYRLKPFEASAKQFLTDALIKFLFGGQLPS